MERARLSHRLSAGALEYLRAKVGTKVVQKRDGDNGEMLDVPRVIYAFGNGISVNEVDLVRITQKPNECLLRFQSQGVA